MSGKYDVGIIGSANVDGRRAIHSDPGKQTAASVDARHTVLREQWPESSMP
jgi:hypothetical protein